MQDFLNWRTDPLLVDNEPTEKSKWLTANDLLENNLQERIFSPANQFQLYSVMIRKIDFVTGERLLQSFPYLLLEQKWLEKLRKQTLSLAERAHHYFKETKADYSIRSWQKKIIKYVEEQGRLPFPLFRLFPNWYAIFDNKQYIQFQSARGEHFQLPLYLTEELAYLSGVIMGDGHLANYFINIIDSSKEHIENLVKSLETTFQTNIEFFAQKNANAWNVNVLGKWIVRFFNFLSGQPINERKYPHVREPLLMPSEPVFRSAFWRGLMDADGSYKSTISFGTASKQLLKDFSDFLTLHNIHNRFYKQSVFGGTTFSLNIAGESRKKFAQLIGTNHPQKIQELEILLSRRVNQFARKTTTLRKQGVWKGQVVDVQEKKLTAGYFNFLLVPYFSLSNFGEKIRKLRRLQNHTQQDLAKEVNIKRTLLSNYEINITTIPIANLMKIYTFYNRSLLDILKEHSKLLIHSRSSHCLIDTRPNEKMLQLLRGLQFKERGCIMSLGENNKFNVTFREELSDYFAIDITSNRFHNSVLNNFVREFFILRK